VLTDEAHRTQYGGLAATCARRCRTRPSSASPARRSTRRTAARSQTFGGYIDQYTIEQAVADGATVPIFYESRLPELRIIGNTLDKLFDRVFADRTEEEREAIKKKYATEQTPSRGRRGASRPSASTSSSTSRSSSSRTASRPGRRRAAGGRGPVQGDARPAQRPAVGVVIISSQQQGRRRLVAAPHHGRGAAQGLIARFLKKDDPLKILIVCDMLLTGFDAPIEQVMYLDSAAQGAHAAPGHRPREPDRREQDLRPRSSTTGASPRPSRRRSPSSPRSDVKGAMTPKATSCRGSRHGTPRRCASSSA
jgi:type I restriction enzyme R subunit